MSSGQPIRIVGVGGLGNRMVHRAMPDFGYGVQAIYIDRDTHALAQLPAQETIQIKSDSEDFEMDIRSTRTLDQKAKDRIRDAIRGASILFLVTALGGATGTAVAPLVVRVANEMDILVISFVAYPHKSNDGLDERVVSAVGTALSAFRRLKGSLIPRCWHDFDTETDLLMSFAFDRIDMGLRSLVAVVTEMLIYGFHCTDLEDLRYVMERPGQAMLGVGASRGRDRVKHALGDARWSIGSGFALEEASGVFVVLTSGTEKFCINEQKHVLNLLRKHLRPDAHISHGWICDPRCGDALRMTLLATGGPGRLINI